MSCFVVINVTVLQSKCQDRRRQTSLCGDGFFPSYTSSSLTAGTGILAAWSIQAPFTGVKVLLLRGRYRNTVNYGKFGHWLEFLCSWGFFLCPWVSIAQFGINELRILSTDQLFNKFLFCINSSFSSHFLNREEKKTLASLTLFHWHVLLWQNFHVSGVVAWFFKLTCLELIPWKLCLYNRLVFSFAHSFIWGQSPRHRHNLGLVDPEVSLPFLWLWLTMPAFPFWCFNDTLPAQWFVFRKLGSDYFCFCFANFLPHFLFLPSSYRKWGSSWLAAAKHWFGVAEDTALGPAPFKTFST